MPTTTRGAAAWLIPILALSFPIVAAAEWPAADGPFRARVRGDLKQELIERGGGTADSERAVHAALLWLARHQSADGSWGGASFQERCVGSACDGAGNGDHGTGVTGLSLLAFLGAGYTHLSKEEIADEAGGETIRSGQVVSQAIRWLVAQQESDGRVGPEVSKLMYNHAIGALALAEAYGMTGSEFLKEPAQKAIDFLVLAKNPYQAWRYTPCSGENDLSVTGWCVMALQAAEWAGLDVPRSAIAEAKAFVEDLTHPKTRMCGYQNAEDRGSKAVHEGENGDYDAQGTMTAVGMLIRIFADRSRMDPDFNGIAAFLATAGKPSWGEDRKSNDYYYWYYGSMALFQFDGPDRGGDGACWRTWNEALLHALVDHQTSQEAECARGSWDSDDRWGREGGRVYATALNALTLEVYYRYTCGLAKKGNAPAGHSPQDHGPSRVGPDPAGSPKFDSPKPGEELASTPMGPRGGRLEAPGRITIDVPPQALVGDEVITLRQGSGGLDGGITYFVEGTGGGHLDLNASATVRIPVPDGTDPDDLVVIQQMDEGAAIGFKPRFDAATGSLVFSVNHFSWLSWGKVQKWAVWAGGWTVMILVASGGGWTLGTFALTCAVGGAWGTIEAPKLERLRQTHGLDAMVRSQHFSILYAREGKYALNCPNPWILVREGDQWSHASAKSVAEARRQHPDAQEMVPVDPAVANLSRELETVYEYYKQAGYAPPDHTWVSAWPGVGITLVSDTEVAGEWDSGPPGSPGFLRINASTIPANQRMDRHQTISHEYFHAICDHHGWDGIAPCTEESLATTMESEIFPSCDGPTSDHPWNESLHFLERGLMAPEGPNERDADGVKRGYWLWPFGKFLLHRVGGHEDVRHYMDGTMQENLLSATFRAFARALCDKEGAPDAEGGASPLVSANEAFQVPTGWGSYSPDSPGICETLSLGVAHSPSTLADVHPLSFSLRRLDLKLPRKFQVEEAPLLVVRRKLPMETEEYLFQSDGGELIASKETLVVGGCDLLGGGCDTLKGRLGIVDATLGPGYDGNPLVAYLLASPGLNQVPPLEEEPQEYPVYRIEPLSVHGVTDGINPDDCAAGYRVLLREKPAEGGAEGKLVESEVLLPLDTKTFDVRDVAGQSPPQSVDVAGICVEDKEVTDESGKPVRSGPFMLAESSGWEGRWMVTIEGEDNPEIVELVSDGEGKITNLGTRYPWLTDPKNEIQSEFRMHGSSSGLDCAGTWFHNLDGFHWRGSFALTMSTDGQSFSGTCKGRWSSDDSTPEDTFSMSATRVK